jgi:hypothetical protein
VTAPHLVPCLAALRAEFNDVNPSRDKGADGWIGDDDHKKKTSDHNPDAQGRVLALDIDSTGPWPAAGWFTEAIDRIVDAHRAGVDQRLEYVIWDREIASRGSRWQWTAYTGSTDPHTGHAHFSARHDHTGESDTTLWGIEDTVTPDDIDKISTAVWAAGFGPKTARESAGDRLGHVDSTVDALTARLTDVEGKLDTILTLLEQQGGAGA